MSIRISNRFDVGLFSGCRAGRESKRIAGNTYMKNCNIFLPVIIADNKFILKSLYRWFEWLELNKRLQNNQ